MIEVFTGILGFFVGLVVAYMMQRQRGV